MNVKMTGNPIVDAIGQLNFEGHQVPHTWYEHLTYTNKRGTYCHHLAVLMLADIVYWHRPTLIKDEQTGQIIGWRKKFYEDKLRRSYKALATQLGATDRQVREAAHFLQDLGLIELEFRTFDTSEGLTLVNVMYISCNPEKISKITFSRREQGGVTEISDTPNSNQLKGVTEISDTPNSNQLKVKPISGEGKTEIGEYTKITSENSSKTTAHNSPPQSPPKSEKNKGTLEGQFEPKVLPEYRTGGKRGEIKPQFLDWLCEVYLPATQYYKKRGFSVDLEDAINWVVIREKNNSCEEILGKFEQMLKNPQNQTKTQLQETYSYYAQALGVDQ